MYVQGVRGDQNGGWTRKLHCNRFFGCPGSTSWIAALKSRQNVKYLYCGPVVSCSEKWWNKYLGSLSSLSPIFRTGSVWDHCLPCPVAAIYQAACCCRMIHCTPSKCHSDQSAKISVRLQKKSMAGTVHRCNGPNGKGTKTNDAIDHNS